jgi:hypothetical protein
MTNGVFSDFEIDKMSVKFAAASGASETAIAMDCVGSVEEELTAKEITKKCRGVVIKDVVKGTGEGTLTISAHVPTTIFTKAFGMTQSDLAEGVQAYGSNSRHKEFCLTMHVLDEDGAEKYKAYPKCIFKARPKINIENGAEEVAEVEMEIAVMPDDKGNGMYEALASGLSSTITTGWMENFNYDLVKTASA